MLRKSDAAKLRVTVCGGSGGYAAAGKEGVAPMRSEAAGRAVLRERGADVAPEPGAALLHAGKGHIVGGGHRRMQGDTLHHTREAVFCRGIR